MALHGECTIRAESNSKLYIFPKIKKINVSCFFSKNANVLTVIIHGFPIHKPIEVRGLSNLTLHLITFHYLDIRCKGHYSLNKSPYSNNISMKYKRRIDGINFFIAGYFSGIR